MILLQMQVMRIDYSGVRHFTWIHETESKGKYKINLNL